MVLHIFLQDDIGGDHVDVLFPLLYGDLHAVHHFDRLDGRQRQGAAALIMAVIRMLDDSRVDAFKSAFIRVHDFRAACLFRRRSHDDDLTTDLIDDFT